MDWETGSTVKEHPGQLTVDLVSYGSAGQELVLDGLCFMGGYSRSQSPPQTQVLCRVGGGRIQRARVEEAGRFRDAAGVLRCVELKEARI